MNSMFRYIVYDEILSTTFVVVWRQYKIGKEAGDETRKIRQDAPRKLEDEKKI